MRRSAVVGCLLASSLLLTGVTRAIVQPSAVASAPPSAGAGQHLYGEYCEACHGANGEGVSGPARVIGAGPLRAQTVQDALGPPLRGVGALAADFYLRTGYMPLQHVGEQPRRSRLALSNAEIQDIVAYVSSLGGGPAVPRPDPARGNLSAGQQMFTDHCAGCHQIAAAGGYVNGGVAPPLSAATPVQIAEAVRIGPYVMPKFSKQVISDAQLDSIVAYVQYADHPNDRGGWALGHLGPVPEGLVAWLIGAAVLVALCVVIGERLRHEEA